MKLISLQIFPSGSAGWSSELLRFGDNITQLYGPNGCGKTPLIQSIPFCLGYPSIFRNDIYERCNYAVLEVQTSKGRLSFKRIYSKDVDVVVTDKDGNEHRFFDEKEVSKFLFDWVGLESKTLVGNNNKSTSAYIATYLPIYYLDQDNGYSAFYCPPRKFIKDQFSEMIRLSFGLPAKNSFNAKKSKIEAKENLDFLDKEVEKHLRQVKLIRNNTSSIILSSDEIENQISSLSYKLDQLSHSSSRQSDSTEAFDQLIANQRSSLNSILIETSEINKRCNGIEKIINEINTEIETLNLNEEARRIFLSFGEICASENCQLFSTSSESYSKNLLYLKDQIKDLERNSELDRVRFEYLIDQKKDIEKSICSAVKKRNKTIENSGMATLVAAISEIKDKLFELEYQLSDLKKVKAIEDKYLVVSMRRRAALDYYQSFTSESSQTPALVKLKSDLRQMFLNWLDDIHTTNISRDITFKDDFTPVLGKEKISQLKGSTKIRAVLAFHAALLELFAEQASHGFNFLILDTPKQHEIHNEDLDLYMIKLKDLCLKHNLQIVFSTTEYHYSGDQFDKTWTPKFPGEDQDMYLRSL